MKERLFEGGPHSDALPRRIKKSMYIYNARSILNRFILQLRRDAPLSFTINYAKYSIFIMPHYMYIYVGIFANGE
jgi:hypothetical protein